MACANAGAGDLDTREFSEWSKAEFVQHRGSCQTLQNVDGDQRCDVRICGVGQEQDPAWRDCLLHLYRDRPRARHGLRTSIQFHWQPCAGGESCGAESKWRGPQEQPCPDCKADTSSKTESLESHGAKKGNPVRQLRSFGVKCARCRVREGGRSVAEFFFANPPPTFRQHSWTSQVAERPGTQPFRQLSRRTRTHHKCHWFSWSFSRTCYISTVRCLPWRKKICLWVCTLKGTTRSLEWPNLMRYDYVRVLTCLVKIWQSRMTWHGAPKTKSQMHLSDSGWASRWSSAKEWSGRVELANCLHMSWLAVGRLVCGLRGCVNSTWGSTCQGRLTQYCWRMWNATWKQSW